MRTLYWKYGILAATWAVLLVVLFVLSPDIDLLVREHGQYRVPEHFPTEIAREILVDNDGFSGEELILVYRSQDGIRDYAEEIQDKLDILLTDPEYIRIENIISSFEDDSMEEMLIGESGKVMVAILQVDMNLEEIALAKSLPKGRGKTRL